MLTSDTSPTRVRVDTTLFDFVAGGESGDLLSPRSMTATIRRLGNTVMAQRAEIDHLNAQNIELQARVDLLSESATSANSAVETLRRRFDKHGHHYNIEMPNRPVTTYNISRLSKGPNL